jgi:hypothetical protein
MSAFDTQSGHHRALRIWIAAIQTAAEMGGSCLALLLAIHHRGTITGRDVMTLPSGYLYDFGIARTAKARGLKMLEQAKLITVKRIPGGL